MQCEMCGKEVESLRSAIVEGTKMQVCSQCAKFGVETAGQKQEVTGRSRVTESLERRQRRMRSRDVFDDMGQKELIPDYGAEIREARQSKGWTLDDLAKKLTEKRSVIAKLEKGDHHPSDRLVKKLEKTLGVTLMEKPEKLSQGQKSQSRALTLGDLIKRELDKK